MDDPDGVHRNPIPAEIPFGQTHDGTAPDNATIRIIMSEDCGKSGSLSTGLVQRPEI
jgi:hypothetical protein